MTNERLCIFLVFSNLIASKLLSSNRRMHNFIEKFTKINDICKKFAGNRVNEHGNVSRRGVIPTFSDLEVIALSLTAEAFGYDSENNLFKRLAESPEHIPNLISRRQFNVRRKLTACLAEDIRRDIAKSIDGGENVFVIDSKPVKYASWHEPSVALWEMIIRKAHLPKAFAPPNKCITMGISSTLSVE